MVWLIWLESQPVNRKVMGFIAVRAHAWVAGSVQVRAAYERQPIHVSLSHPCFSPSLSPSLPSPLSMSSGEDLKKKN